MNFASCQQHYPTGMRPGIYCLRSRVLLLNPLADLSLSGAFGVARFTAWDRPVRHSFSEVGSFPFSAAVSLNFSIKTQFFRENPVRFLVPFAMPENVQGIAQADIKFKCSLTVL